MMRNRVILIACILLCAAFYSPEKAIAETIVISAGEWAPYLSEKSKHNGIAGRIITDIFSAEGIDVEFRFVPWKRAYKNAAAGVVDATALWLKKPEREKDFLYSDEVIIETHVFFFKKGTDFKWNKIADITSYKMGGLFGFSYGSELDKIIEEGLLKIDRAARDEQNFLKLLAGRIDIYPQELNVAYECLYSNFFKGEIALIDYDTKPLMTNPSFLLFPKKNPKSERYHSLFNKGLLQLKKAGKVNQYIMEARKGF